MEQTNPEIEERMAKIEELRLQMGDICEQFVKASISWLSDWYEAQTLNALESKQDVAEKMSDDDLRDLNKEVKDLIPDPRELMTTPSWPHLLHSTDPADYLKPPLWTDFMGVEEQHSPYAYLRTQMNKLGKVLVDHLLISKSLNGWELKVGGCDYIASPWYSEEMQTALEAYNQSNKQLIMSLVELGVATREKGVSEIRRRWENIN